MKIMTRRKATLLCWKIIAYITLLYIGIRLLLNIYIDFPPLIDAVVIALLAIHSLILLCKGRLRKTNEAPKKDIKKTVELEKPLRSFNIFLFAFIGLAYSIVKGVYLIEAIVTCHTNNIPFKVIVPSCIETLTLILCSIFILLIAINARKKQIFTLRNARYIDCIGYTILLNTYIQHYYWNVTEMIPNMTVRHCFYLFALFTIFFGRLFAIAVKMREEQDLTI